MSNSLKMTLALLSAMLAPIPALAQTNEGGPGYWHNGWDLDWGWSHMVFGSLMMIAFWGGIILFVALAVRWFVRNAADRKPTTDKSAFEVLKIRFARGEIDKKEYDDRKRHLSI